MIVPQREHLNSPNGNHHTPILLRSEHKSAGDRFKLTFNPQFGISYFSYMTANRFAVANTEMATRTKIAVLIGTKEQVALYPNKEALLAFGLGITVLIAAIPKTTIVIIKTTVNAFIVVFHPPFHLSTVPS
jgi:hypothetical protein